MTTDTITSRLGRSMKRFRSGSIFVALLTVLICCAVVGVQPGRASGSCTALQCQYASNHAFNACIPYGGVLYFECPFNSGNEPDDFLFECFDHSNSVDGIFDCDTWNPS
jgi:hypothetical protein